MSPKHQLPLLALAVALAIALGGCSGAGQSAAQTKGASVSALATDQVSTALLLKQLLLFLHLDQGMTLASAAPRTGRRVAPSSVTPDPGKTVDFAGGDTNSDGSTWYYIQYSDLSGVGEITLASGRTKTIWWGVPVTQGGGVVLVQAGGETWDDGTVLTYTWNKLPEASPGDSHQSWTGALQATDGKRQQFSVDRSTQREIVHVALSDGATLDATVPLTATWHKPFWPDFAAGWSGTYVGTAGAQAFTLKGTPDDSRWRTLGFAAPGGWTADYGLGTRLAGSGQIAREGQLLGTLIWDANATGTLYQTGQEALAVVPTDAARRFAVDQWVYSIATLAPAPTW